MKRLFAIEQHNLQCRLCPLFVPLVFVRLDERLFVLEEGSERLGYI
jgi:hypothetical protein